MAEWLPAFRYAVRTLRRQRTFTLVALLTLALGIGANTALFSIIRAVVLNPLPYEDPGRIVVIGEVNPDGVLDRVSVPTFEDWKQQANSLESVAAYRRVDVTFAGAGAVELRTGKVRWSEERFRAGSITLAGERLLIVRERGEMILAPASPDGFKPIVRAQVLQGTVRAYPALADGYVYLRNDDTLVCL